MEHIFLASVFGSEDPDKISSMLVDLPRKILSSGTILFSEGDISNELHLVLSGRVEVSIKTSSGKPKRLDVLERGQLVGEMAVLDDGPRSATVTALEKTELAVIDRQHFLSLCAEDPKIPFRVASLLSSRLRMTDRIIAAMEQVRSGTERLIIAQQEERRKISERIMSGPLKYAQHIAEIAKKHQDFPPACEDDLALSLTEIVEETNKSVKQIKELALQLNPENLESTGLVPTLVSTIARFSPQLSTRLHFLRGDNLPHLEKPQEIALYTIALEALNNIREHADANNTWIRIATESSKYVMEIRDDGNGFKPLTSGEQLNQRGLGLKCMKEQAEAIGADLIIDSAPGSGTKVILRIDTLRADS